MNHIMRQAMVEQAVADIKSINKLAKTLDLDSGDVYGMLDNQLLQCLNKATECEDMGLIDLMNTWEVIADLYHVEQVKLLETERMGKCLH